VKVITRQTLANEALQKWVRQYHASPGEPHYSWANPIKERLMALGPSPEPDAVDAAVQNGSWTQVPACDECGGQPEIAVCVGQEPDYDSRTAFLCRACLVEALKKLEEAMTNGRHD
jgi:hypothetical protein